jgi:hypothetical protein
MTNISDMELGNVKKYRGMLNVVENHMNFSESSAFCYFYAGSEVLLCEFTLPVSVD